MLFKSTADLQPYTEVNSAVNFDSLKRSIVAAEHECIVPVIGLSLYNVLNAAYTAAAAETDLSDPYQALLPYIRTALAPYAMKVFADKAELQFTDGGLRREETANSKTAFQYQATNLKAQLKKESDAGVEMLLAFLEENRDDYDEWTSSAEFSAYRSLFITTGSEFNKYYVTEAPQRNYRALRAVMRNVEELIIKKGIGKELYADLKTKTTAVTPATLNDNETALMEILKNAIANLTIARGYAQLAVRIDDGGVTVTAQRASATNDEISKRAGAMDPQLTGAAREAYDTGMQYLADAIEYLVKYASTSIFIPWYTVNSAVLLAAVDTSGLSINQTLNGSFAL